MSLIPINKNPDRKTLAEFSEFSLFFLGMVFAPLSYLRGRPTAAALFWVAAVAIRLVGAVRPEALQALFVGLMIATAPIGWLVSHATLGLLYYGVITPIGLVFRLLGRDPLNRTFDPAATTYWEPYNPDRGLERYLRQF